MLKIFTVIFGLISANIALAKCKLDLGRYVTAGGSEYLSTLIFSSNGGVLFEHEHWNPGGYEERVLNKTDGTWSCDDVDVSMTFDDKKYIATLKPVGFNPLGIQESKLILYVSDVEKTGSATISGEVFYKECLLN